MRRVALVAAHFPPSNLASVHRARLWAQHLGEFGWEPVVVTTDWRFYEERLDWDLCKLLPARLDVVRTGALPTKPVRLFGDLGLRAWPWHYGALSRLAREKRLDFIHITIPSHYSALLGRPIQRKYGTPYGIDYIDPWVHHWPGTERRMSKAWLSMHLSKVLEPWALAHARLITGVAPLYFEDVLKRHPALGARVVTAAMPYGAAEEDFRIVADMDRAPELYHAGDGLFHMIYAGAMLPKAYPVLERLLAAIRQLADTQPRLMQPFRLHFIGTGRSPDDANGYNVLPYIERFGVGRWVTERPHRMGYVEILHHLRHAGAVLVMGSTEPHYTPSKVFQAVQSRRPVLALLHERSTAADFLREARAGRLVTFAENELPSAGRIADALKETLVARGDAQTVDWKLFQKHSARESARTLAQALDRACELDERLKRGSA